MNGIATLTPAAILRRAADGLRTGRITWGVDNYIGDNGCRCALGAVAWAADPADADGDPNWIDPEVRRAAQEAADALAAFLVMEWGAPAAGHHEEPTPGREIFVLDPVETVGGWNDMDGRTEADVINALTFAAARSERSR